MMTDAPASFIVDGMFEIEGYGPVMTSSVGVAAGTFQPGDILRCGSLEARILGIESFGKAQKGLLVGIPTAQLQAGQVWTLAHRDGATPGTPIAENHALSCHRAHPGVQHGEWERRRRAGGDAQ